jgi:type I restriction enzyme S subunit
MIVKTIPSSWLVEEEHRLDCGPFVKGSIEAKKKIASLHYRKDQLVELTQGGLAGMYHVGQDKIVWTEDSTHGIPFLRSSDILKADLSNQPFISRKQVAANALFQCPAGTTLITRSGTIGRMTYMRPDMVDMAISQDVLKVVPDASKVMPGYLYAFLTSKYGLPIVIGGTFGSIIVHIEAENIADLPVPRLGEHLENRVHRMIQQACDNRVTASSLIAENISDLAQLLGISESKERAIASPSLTIQSSSCLLNRMDSFYYSKSNVDARAAFDAAGDRVGKTCVGEIAEAYIPDIFKRLYADDPNFGYPYFTGKEIYEIDPTTALYLKKDIAELNRLLIKRGMILIQDSGQVSGIIGHPVHVGRHMNGAACTNNMVRILSKRSRDNGYLFALLSTRAGIRLLKREASGSSIPHLEEKRIRGLVVPWPKQRERDKVGDKIWAALDLRDAAIDLERQARAVVELTIEEGDANG